MRPGGRIGLANWTPDSLIGSFSGRSVSICRLPQACVRRRSGEPKQALQELFAGHTIALTPRKFVFRYRSAAHWLEVFRAWYGPVQHAFAALDAEDRKALEADILSLLQRFSRGGEPTLIAPSHYVEVSGDKHAG